MKPLSLQRVESIPNLKGANRGMALDAENGRVFYSSDIFGRRNIWVTEIGGEKSQVAEIENSEQIFFYDDTIFWYDGRISLFSIPFPRTLGIRPKQSKIDHALNFLLLSSSGQPTHSDPCEHSDCSDLCLRSDSNKKFSCACPTGIKFAKINGVISQNICNKKVEDVMVMAQSRGLFFMSLDTEDHQPVKLLDYQSEDQQE